MIAPDTPDHHKRMCRIYLHEAHKTMHRSWAFVLLEWCGERRRKAQQTARNERTARSNAAIYADRLRSTWITRSDRCFICGEILYPWPEPTYWMEYPLMQASIVDGNLVCDGSKNRCLDQYLLANPPVVKKKHIAMEVKPGQVQGDLFGDTA